MIRYTSRCPSCGAEVDLRTVPILRSYSFSCPICDAPIRIAAAHTGLFCVTSLIFSVALTFYFGFRGLAFALISIVGSGLIFAVSCAVMALVRPATLELRPSKDSNLRLRFGPRG
jgi:prepilin signal peptidase PulO-like enzyme (type II secretory pathway)